MSYEFNLAGLGTNGEAEDDGETLFEQGWEWFREIAARKQDEPAGKQAPVPMPGMAPGGKPSATGFSSYAGEAAVREVAAIDEEMAPIEETPPGSPEAEESEERTGIERYQTHITLISTVVGLGTFIVWLLVRKKDRRR